MESLSPVVGAFVINPQMPDAWLELEGCFTMGVITASITVSKELPEDSLHFQK